MADITNPTVLVLLSQEEHTELDEAAREAGIVLPKAASVHPPGAGTLYAILLDHTQLTHAVHALENRGMTIPAGPRRQAIRDSYQKILGSLFALRVTLFPDTPGRSSA